MKRAVYVEGQSELLFVADVLQKYSGYDPGRCGFLCINLTADNYDRINYPQQGGEDSQEYYQIVNVNNDNLVVSKLRKDVPGLIGQGYEVIIGLRDVFGEAYEHATGGEPTVNRTVIEEMHALQSEAIGAPEGSDCRLHFAIMEYEAWMFALIENYVKGLGKDLAAVCEQQGIDLTVDPEQAVYYPYPLVRKIYQACGEDYHKHGGESYSFLSSLTVEDYERLRLSGRCASFGKFLESLLGSERPQLP